VAAVSLVTICVTSILTALRNEDANNSITFNVLTSQTVQLPKYSFSDLDVEKRGVFGVEPMPIGVPKDIILQGFTLYTPYNADGTLDEKNRAICTQYNNYENQNRKVLSFISETNEMKIENSIKETNRGLDIKDDAWSSIANVGVKLYRYDSDKSMFAIMILKGHFWRIEGYQLTEDEFVTIVKKTIKAYT
jgi:hypothetical protein